MVQFNSEKQQKLNNNDVLYEVNMVANPAGQPIGGVNAYGKPVMIIDDDTVQHTSKNRRKVSNFEIVDFCSFQYDTESEIFDQILTGTADAQHDVYLGMVKLMVGGNAGDQVIRQTRRVIRYIPGRQNEVSMSAIFGAPTTGIRRRFGIFDERNGAYFEDGGDGAYYVVCRRDTASGIVEERVARADWNVDKLDGDGPSSIEFNPLNVQLMVIEYEWYGAGLVEFKFVIDNNAYPVHQFTHGNLFPYTWSSNAFLPVRIELTNVAGTAGSHTFYQGSHSVLSEGFLDLLGREKSVATDITGYSMVSANTFYPIINIRLKNNKLNGVVLPTSFTAATLDNTNIFFKIVRNGVLTGGSWVPIDSDGHVEYNNTATGVTGGEVLQTGFISSGNLGNVYTFSPKAITQLARTTTTSLGDTSDIFTVAVASSQANKSGFASLSWIEVR